MKKTRLFQLTFAAILLAILLVGCREAGDKPSTTAGTTATETTPATSTITTAPMTPTVSVTTTAPVTTEKTPETAPPVTAGTVETLPPLEITIPIPDPGEMSAELETEIVKACAKQYNEKAEDLSVQFVADLGDAYAVFVDGPWDYPCKYSSTLHMRTCTICAEVDYGNHCFEPGSVLVYKRCLDYGALINTGENMGTIQGKDDPDKTE